MKDRNRILDKRFTTREQNIAVRLSGKVKNFTGRGPGVIKVKINDNFVTVQFKWFLTAMEKEFLENCNDKRLVNKMRHDLLEVAKDYLHRAFSEVFQSEVKIMEVNEDSLQEKLSIQVQVMGLAS